MAILLLQRLNCELEAQEAEEQAGSYRYDPARSAASRYTGLLKRCLHQET